MKTIIASILEISNELDKMGRISDANTLDRVAQVLFNDDLEGLEEEFPGEEFPGEEFPDEELEEEEFSGEGLQEDDTDDSIIAELFGKASSDELTEDEKELLKILTEPLDNSELGNSSDEEDFARLLGRSGADVSNMDEFDFSAPNNLSDHYKVMS